MKIQEDVLRRSSLGRISVIVGFGIAAFAVVLFFVTFPLGLVFYYPLMITSVIVLPLILASRAREKQRSPAVAVAVGILYTLVMAAAPWVVLGFLTR
jgi:hypothetical protein